MIEPSRAASTSPVPLKASRTPTLPPATHTNSYALGEREIVLVEPATPYAEERRDWLEWARGFQSRGQSLLALLLTHHHADHVGGATFLAERLGVPIWAHAQTAERLPEISVARHLTEGDTIELSGPNPQRWHVLHTPGHAPGHVCLHEQRLRALVVGDMVASVGTILIAPGDGDMARYLKELARLQDLAADVALPAHGAPISEPCSVFARYIAHRLAREAKILAALVARGDATLDELLPAAYDDAPQEIWPLARLSLEAHLDKLVTDGAVERSEEERYVATSAA